MKINEFIEALQADFEATGSTAAKSQLDLIEYMELTTYQDQETSAILAKLNAMAEAEVPVVKIDGLRDYYFNEKMHQASLEFLERYTNKNKHAL